MLLIVPLALVAAACSSDDSGDATDSTEAATEATDAATEATDAATEAPSPPVAATDSWPRRPSPTVPASPLTDIGPTIPLDGVPEPKKVGWLECEQPSCAAITPGFEAATAALGWELVTIPATSFDQGPAIQQALDEGVDFIAHTGSPLATAERADRRRAGRWRRVLQLLLDRRSRSGEQQPVRPVR